MSVESFEGCATQPPDAWGFTGPNQAIGEADCKEQLSQKLFRGHIFTGATRNLGNVRAQEKTIPTTHNP